MDADNGEVLLEISEAIGVTTNNVAEYRGLIAGLRAAKDLDPEHILVRMDSKLVVEQSAGRWKVKAEHIAPLRDEVQRLVRELGVKVTFAHIPRALNSHADRLANQAMDGGGTTSAPESFVSAQPTLDAPPPQPRAWTDAEAKVPANKRLAGWNKPAEAPTTMVLLRHGESTLSIDRRFNGSSDPPLTERGVNQARAAAARLAASRKEVITAVITSPLQRAYRTAEISAEALNVPLHVDEGYRETDFGAWEGMTYSEVAKAHAEELKAWHGDFAVAPAGGESFLETEERVRAARERTVERFPGTSVLVVAHVTPIKVLLWQALQASPEVLFRSALDLASFTEIDWYPDGGSVLKRFNDAAHLDPL